MPLKAATTAQEALLSDQKLEALSLVYGEAKNLLRAISMAKAGVLSLEQLLIDLREHSELIGYAVDELHAPALRPADGLGDVLDWLTKRRVIHGALKQCIDAHGPITGLWIGSAAKRIRGIMRKRLLDYRKATHPARSSSSLGKQGKRKGPAPTVGTGPFLP